jgi:hypothetical protein
VAVERVFVVGKTVHVLARTCGSEAACPECGTVSRRVHSRYRRQLADTACGGQEVAALDQGLPLASRGRARSQMGCAPRVTTPV